MPRFASRVVLRPVSVDATVPARPPRRFHLDFPPELPISARAEEITAALQQHPVLILAGETGSGKSTQIPKLCLAAGRGTAGRIACTQPRRVAALSLSRRVAEELGVPWGREVGCKIRFTDRTSAATIIKYLTDGMLLAELQGDPALREYDTIILDEAHERSLNIDFLLGHLRQLRFRRPDLRVVITSATIDTEAFSRAFDGAPVIEVSGRLHPVEVIYAPLDELGSDAAADDEPAALAETELPGAARAAKAEALHYVDGAVAAVERVLRESPAGDILVFMPAERDIRETCDLLAGRRFPRVEVVPLFGRLTNTEQQRVFAPTSERRIVVATNIAETSLTIPGIRFVIDTGLARLSRYAAPTRTRRLPIEPVARSSADQRKGRCGRVAAGVCIRLYSEQDYLDRPRFTQPEIQRCNLADVILRLRVFGLGDIERFPFLNAPPAKAVRAGYQLLHELGALAAEADAGSKRAGPAPAVAPDSPPAAGLTEIGRELARLPVDPTVGRMILQARTERCVTEVLVIAAGLSIQDPRERPLDRRAQADAAHRRFAHPDSDFLTLLNIWEALHGDFEAMTQSRLRRFCHEHFLSYTRLREWRDVHDQLREVLAERDDFKFTSVHDGLAQNPKLKTQDSRLDHGSPGYRAIHRSILAGLLGNIAMLEEASGLYHAAHGRKVTLFPGSVLFRREEPRKKPRPEGRVAADADDSGRRPPRAARWIMAAEIVETTRLYARTAARIDPAWAVDLGAHLLAISHADPFWDEAAGRVLVHRRSRLYGLELASETVGYGRIDPVRATGIFIREGLVNDTVSWPFDFLAHNRQVRAQVESILARTRSRGFLDLAEAAYQFYARRLLPAGAGRAGMAGVSSVAELVDLVRERRQTEPEFLQMEPEDLRGPAEAEVDAAAFPEALELENRVLPLDYAYRPGQEDDGVTLIVSAREAEQLTPAALDWAIPGHLEEKVLLLLKALPTGQRRQLIPLAETAAEATRALQRRGRRHGEPESLTDVLAAHLREAHRLAVDPAGWAERPLPEHLRVRVQVVDEGGRVLVAGRDLAAVREHLERHRRLLSSAAAREDAAPWRRARARWEKEGQETWTFGEIPERILVGEVAGVPVHAYPALVPGQVGVALRLLQSPEEAAAAMPRGLARLFELQLRYELAWLERDLRTAFAGRRGAAGLALAAAPDRGTTARPLSEQALAALRRWACERPVEPRTAAAFTRVLEGARADLRGIVPRLTDLLQEILGLRQALRVHADPFPGLEEDLAALLPPDFLAATPFSQLAQLPRYLRAMSVRADRWRRNPARDRERTRQLAPYVQAVAELARAGIATPEAARFRWLVEEFRVSVFAQELGTAEPVSAVKLDRMLRALRGGGAAPPAARSSPPAPVAAPPGAGPIKTLGALDRLFPRG